MFDASNIAGGKEQLIELIRQLSEFIMYGQKYAREEYFQAFVELDAPAKLGFIHQEYIFEINQ